MHRHPTVLAATAVIFGLFSAGPAAAQVDAGPCAARFPDSTFEVEAAAGPVAVYGSGVTQPLLDRYASDWKELVDVVQGEMGGLDGATVCVFDDQIPLDAQALGWAPGHFLRAIAFGEEQLVVVSSWLIAETPDAGRSGLLHVAQYQVSGGTYPEPFGNEVKGWYRNRIDRTVEVVHNAFVRQNTGLSEPWQPFPWTVGQMVDPLLWNPEFGYGGAGDFANYAVANGGDGVLRDPLNSDLTSLDERWRQSLFDESGAILGGSRGWILGLSMAIGIVLLGVVMALWNRRQKKILEERLRDLEWLERQVGEVERAAVRPSVAVGGGRRNSGIGSSPTDPGFDGDDRDGPPSDSSLGSRRDRVSRRRKSGDDIFRHPGFDGDD